VCGRLMFPAQETQSMREIRLLRGRLPQKGGGLTGMIVNALREYHKILNTGHRLCNTPRYSRCSDHKIPNTGHRLFVIHQGIAKSIDYHTC
jgi:hypothetical protein